MPGHAFGGPDAFLHGELEWAVAKFKAADCSAAEAASRVANFEPGIVAERNNLWS